MTDGRPTVVVLADDLIWATRLASIVERIGATPRVAGTAEHFLASLAGSAGALVDLSLRGADPIAAIRAANSAGVPVAAVGPHEDRTTREAALAAGAGRVFAYRKLHADGPRVVGRALGLPPAPASGPATADRSTPAAGVR